MQQLLVFDPTNDFARIQLVLYYRDADIKKADELAQESRILIPNSPWFSYLLSSIKARQSKCAEAEKYGEEAIAKSSNDPHIKNLVNSNMCIDNL